MAERKSKRKSVGEKIEAQLRRESHDRYWENQIDSRIQEEKGKCQK